MKTEREIEDIIKEAAQRVRENRNRRAANALALAQQEPSEDLSSASTPGESG